jgi:hypothetical protein
MEEKSGLILPWLPDKFEQLAKQEEDIRSKSILTLNAHQELKDHVNVIYSSLNLVFELTITYKNRSDDELTIQYLGIRLFNSVISSIKLLLAGYYQGSVIFQRDILEVGYLLDYFLLYPENISDWKKSTAEERFKKYRPKKIRRALDNRDGFQDEKRSKKYRVMCEYAAHATFSGLKLIAPKKLITLGPFLDAGYLRFVLEELALDFPLFALIYPQHFKEVPSEIGEKVKTDMNDIKKWANKYLKLGFERDGFVIQGEWITATTTKVRIE